MRYDRLNDVLFALILLPNRSVDKLSISQHSEIASARRINPSSDWLSHVSRLLFPVVYVSRLVRLSLDFQSLVSRIIINRPRC
jgi:hypothetical protein